VCSVNAENFLNLVFYCLIVLFIEKNVTCLKRFTRYGHYAGETVDIITGRLAVVLNCCAKN